MARQMRSRSAVESDIASTRAKLRALCAEWRQVRRTDCETIGREFDAGFTLESIAQEHGISEAAVRAKLWRSGRTSKGRTAIRRLIHENAAPRAVDGGEV